ncbi:Der1-like family-domain-containing protein [Elsinoe ampelina]|uniref:Derlin n=1 Tax=Elsinoe ampelina TaxID=302913 RepID=A0A6A6GLU1_9PEZI|nr:Der1-like family-domain-containing protein [Elsinoe ampelina]
MDAFLAQPPVTRTITAGAVLLSVSVWVLHLVSPYYVVFIPQLVFTYKKIPQLWRLITPFLLTGKGFGMIMDPYFLFTYGKKLEVDAPRFQAPGEFFTAIAFICAVIVFLGGYVLGSFVLLSPLTLAFAYLYSVDTPETRISFFIVQVRAKYLPYCLLLMALVMAGPGQALGDASGLIAAHLYDFLTRLWPQFGGGRNVIVPPQFVKRWFMKPGGRASYRSYGTAFEARAGPNTQQPASGGGLASWASGFSSGSWVGRGPGRRLGGE